MITNSPNPEDIGIITDQIEKLEEYKQKVAFGTGSFVETALLQQRERQALENIPQQERLAVFNDMRSKNKSAQRRAKKKIADASRRKNRK